MFRWLDADDSGELDADEIEAAIGLLRRQSVGEAVASPSAAHANTTGIHVHTGHPPCHD